MGSLLDWAVEFNSKKRKPNKAVVDELNRRIDGAMRVENPDLTDGVNALLRFDKSVIAPFCRDVYAKWPEQLQARWDDMLLNPAASKEFRNRVRTRLPQILLAKLGASVDISKELRWLLDECPAPFEARDGAKAKNFQKLAQALRQEIPAESLRKLLDVDASVYEGYARQALTLFEALFADSGDRKTRDAFVDFLRRNGQPDNAPAMTLGENQGTVSANAVPTANAQETSAETLSNAEAVRMTERVLAYLRAQARRGTDNMADVQKLSGELSHARSLNDTMGRQISELKATLSETNARCQELEARLAQADERVRALEADKGDVERDLRQIQGMFDYNSRQKGAAYKDKLASDLYLLKQFTKEDLSHYTDAERAEAYQAVIEETVSVLLRHGIDVREG